MGQSRTITHLIAWTIALLALGVAAWDRLRNKPVRDVGPLEPDNRHPFEELYPLPPETGEDKNKREPADRVEIIERLYRLKKAGSISEAEFERLIARL